MVPTSYYYRELDGRFRLYLGGVSTLYGLQLLQRETPVSKMEVYTHPEGDWLPPERPRTVSSVIECVEAIPDHAGIYDFSCDLVGGGEFSTHDDSECHFVLNDQDSIRDLVDAAADIAVQARLWEMLQENIGCYVVVTPDHDFRTYADFDALLASQDD